MAVVNQVKEDVGVDIPSSRVREAMHDLGMRYRKVSQIPMLANSERSLVLRQRWALAFLGLDHSKKIILNVDETWLGMSDFRRRKWQAPGTNNSVKAFSMVPRVSMFIGVDTLGNVYLSLNQSNSN